MRVGPEVPNGCAVVAGGSGGLGAEICLALARAGLPVVVGYRNNPDKASNLVEEIERLGGRAWAWRLDLVQAVLPHDLERIRRECGPISAAVYAAGPASNFDFVSRVPLDEWRRVFEGDVIGCIALAQAVIPHLRETRGSFTALATYQAAKIEVRGGLSSVPKAAVERLVQAIAREEARYGVRANAVRAGWIRAGGGERLTRDLDVRAQKLSDIPLGRLGEPWELAEAVSFLASPKATFITGVALTVDGGESL